MPASTALITDIGTVISNGPSATTIANSIAATGPIMDYRGNTKLIQGKFQEALVLLGKIVDDTDSTDSTNLTLLNGIVDALDGSGSPSSALLTDIASVISNGPNSATVAKAIAAAGKIMDYLGNCKLVQLMLQEAKILVAAVYSNTANSDDSSNRTTLNNLTLALA